MRARILGSAAGGAFPQWNCGCPNCRALRSGTFHGKARTQTQVAIRGDSDSWFLLGASPDLRAQIEAIPELHPHDGSRQSPIAGAVLLNADIDHVLGLLLLRELQPLCVYASDSIRRILCEDNSMFAMLQRVPGQLSWTTITQGTSFCLISPAGLSSALNCRTISLSSHFPAYVAGRRRTELTGEEASQGLMLESSSGNRLAYLPAVPKITQELIKELETADVVLFDGTFWSDDELIRFQGSGQTAQQMGHVPVSGNHGSIALLAQLNRPRKIYIHINNTNPMLNQAGPEYRQVRNAGWEIAEDGWQFEL